MSKSFSHVVGKWCKASRMTKIVSTHGGLAAKPQLVSHTSNGSAVCTMGVEGSRLVSSLELRVQAERESTLMIDSKSPVKLLPNGGGSEFGIGIHALAENDSLLVITPEAHVPHLDAFSGLWTRYDLSPRASLVSVQLADLRNQAARPPTVGGRYTARTRVHHTTAAAATGKDEGGLPLPNNGEGTPAPRGGEACPRAAFRADASLSFIGSSCAAPSISSCGLPFAASPTWSCDWTYGRRFKGLVMGTKTSNVVASVLLSGPRAAAVADAFRDVASIPQLSLREAHEELGLHGDGHLALQELALPNGDLTVVRIATEHLGDMHRLLHRCLMPLEAELGVAPYARFKGSQRRAPREQMGTLFAPAFHIADPSVDVGLDVDGEQEEEDEKDARLKTLHVQHAS
jgi:hypothetical protein